MPIDDARQLAAAALERISESDCGPSYDISVDRHGLLAADASGGVFVGCVLYLSATDLEFLRRRLGRAPVEK